MANLHAEPEQPPALTPLLSSNSNSISNHNHIQAEQSEEKEDEETQLDQTLRRLETFLAILGFKQSSVLSFALSWTAFMVVGVVVPLVALHFCDCSDCDKYQITDFEMDVVAFQACLAAVSLVCLSHNLRKYGLRRFLFVDRYSGQMACFHNDYVKQISVSESNFLIYLRVVNYC